MKITKLFARFSLFVLAGTLVLSGCKPDPDECDPCPPPVDGNPEITILSPANGLMLAEVDSILEMSFQIYDNELITSYWATHEITSATGGTILAETQIPGSFQTLSTQGMIQNLLYKVPAYPPYTEIIIRGYVQDSRGKQAMTSFTINIVPAPGDTTLADSLQTYNSDDTIWSGLSASNDYNFSLIYREHGDNVEIDAVNRDIREISTGGVFTPMFSSPNNGTKDSVIVHTDLAHFDWTNATYNSIWQAFVTSTTQNDKTGVLKAGDVVLLKMANIPNYAAIWIKEIGTDFIVFRYKYSH